MTVHAQRPPLVAIGAGPLSLSVVEAIAHGAARVGVAPEAIDRCEQADRFLDRLVGERRRIYGVTTGFGPIADTVIHPEQSRALQRNLVYHLASGVGDQFSPAEARAIMVARLATLAQGRSAARPEILQSLVDVLNAGLAPAIPEKGTVGASGDLTPLAHMALALMGEGAFLVDRTPLPAAEILKAHGLEPVVLERKDGLALVNGTSAMTGIAALNGGALRRLLGVGVRSTLLYAEAMGARWEGWHPLVGEARPHPGQRRIHALLREAGEGTQRLRPFARIPEPIGPTGANGVGRADDIAQDPYSIRCAPQILGAILDMLEVHDRVVETELTSVTDNPLVFAEEETIVHGGNFMGQHVAFAADILTNAAIQLAVLAERQIARITDVTLSNGLPPFLQGQATGLQSGFMGAQVTATALVAEMRTHAMPASIQSIPTNGNNQDVVSMGTIAARRCRCILRDVSRVLAIEALVLAQAYDLRIEADDSRAFSPASRSFHASVRGLSRRLGDDRPLSSDIESMAATLLDPARGHEFGMAVRA